MATAQARTKTTSSPTPPTSTQRPWSERLPEAVLLGLVVAVPLLLNTRSRSIMDVKEVVLGLGVFLGLSLWLLASLAEGRFSWASSRLNVVVLAYAAWAGMSMAYSRFWWVSVSDYGRLLCGVGLFLLTIVTVRSYASVRRVAFAACISGFLMALYGWVQQLGYEPLGVEWTKTEGRIFSFAANPTYLAGYLVLLLPLVLAVGWFAPRAAESQKPEGSPLSLRSGAVGGALLVVAATALGFDRRFQGDPLWLVWYAVLLAAVLLAAGGWGSAPAGELPWPRGRRAAYGVMVLLLGTVLLVSVTFAAIGGLALGAAAAGLLVLVRGRGKGLRKVVLALVAAAIVFPVLGWLAYPHLPKRQQARVDRVLQFKDPSASERQLQWRAAYNMFRERPWLGEGYSVFRVQALEQMAADWYAQRGKRVDTAFTPNHAHHEFLQILAETGVVGGVLFLALCCGVLATGARVALRHPEAHWRQLGLAITAGSIAFLFQNLFGITFRIVGTAMFFWLGLGLLVVAASRLQAEEGRSGGVTRRRFRRVPWGAVMLVAGVLGVALWGLGVTVVRPMAANVTIRLTGLRVEQGRYPEAIAFANRTLQLCPYSSDAYYRLSYCYGKLGQYEEAVEASKAALRLLPGNASAYYNLGIAYHQWGKLEQAAENLQRAIDLMPVPDNYLGLAQTRVKQGDYVAAEQLVQEAARRQERLGADSAQRARMHLILADVYAKGGHEEEALAAVARAAELAPENPKTRSWRIELLMHLKRLEAARQEVAAWVKAEPNSAAAWSTQGTVYHALGNDTAAQTSLERARELDPQSPEVRLALAQVCAVRGDTLARQRKCEEAVPHLRRAFELAPELPRLRERLAYCYSLTGDAKYQQGQYRAAEEDFRRAIEYGPVTAELHFELGLCYAKLGDSRRAREQFEVVARTGGDSAVARGARRLLAGPPG